MRRRFLPLFLVLVAAAEALAGKEKIRGQVAVPSDVKEFSLQWNQVVPNVIPQGIPQGKFCKNCLLFAEQSFEQLLQQLGTVGIAGGCRKLCGTLPTEPEQKICFLICEYVGYKLFVDVVLKADLDPFYACDLLKLCPVIDGGVANITSLEVSPKSGPQGADFEFKVAFTVTKATNAGQIKATFYPPCSSSDVPFSFVSISAGFVPGTFVGSFVLTAEPTEEQTFGPGDYATQVDICSGECTSLHPHSGVYDSAITTFQIISEQAEAIQVS